MSYLDTTLTPASGYASVNMKQVYDVISAQLMAHPAWEFIESCDWVSGTSTYTSYVWRCNKAVSTLVKDFYIAFRLQQVSGSYLISASSQIFLFEDYDLPSHTASRPAPLWSASTFTLQSDQTHPATWVLTANVPTGANTLFYAGYGPVQAVSQYRMLLGVTSDGIYIGSGSATVAHQTYVGAFDSLMNSTDDPFPLLIASTDGSNGNNSGGFASSTRHPKLTPGTMTYAFGYSFGDYSTSGSTKYFGQGALLSRARTTSGGILGDVASPNWDLFSGGSYASRCCVSTVQYSSISYGSTRGGLRGYLKNMLSGQLAPHSAGDTFLVDGKSYVGLGLTQYGIWDTTA